MVVSSIVCHQLHNQFQRLLDGLEPLKSKWDEVVRLQSFFIGQCDVYRFKLPVTLVSDITSTTLEDTFLDLRLADPSELARAAFVVLKSDHPLLDRKEDESTRKGSYTIWLPRFGCQVLGSWRSW